MAADPILANASGNLAPAAPWTAAAAGAGNLSPAAPGQTVAVVTLSTNQEQAASTLVADLAPTAPAAILP